MLNCTAPPATGFTAAVVTVTVTVRYDVPACGADGRRPGVSISANTTAQAQICVFDAGVTPLNTSRVTLISSDGDGEPSLITYATPVVSAIAGTTTSTCNPPSG
jgi:hypothetical protein